MSFELEGARLSRRARRAIAGSFRPVPRAAADEAALLEEIRRETVSALRADGYLEPRVGVTVEPGEVADEQTADSLTADSLTVRIRAEVGRRIDPGTPAIEGLPSDEAAILAAQFGSRLERVELAAAVPGADRYLLRSLAVHARHTLVGQQQVKRLLP